MRVLHLVANQPGTGAWRGAHWLHLALRELGVESLILTKAYQPPDDPTVLSLSQTKLQKLTFKVLPRLARGQVWPYRNREPVIFNTGFDGVDFTSHPAYRQADLIHLHWINGLVRMRTLRKIAKPIVWTMRDMWPFTGGCHYSLECERYREGCGRCPQLGSSSNADLSRLVIRHKQANVPRDLHAVGISTWLSECAARSQVMRGMDVRTIFNNVDTTRFSPIDKSTARRVLGLPCDRRLVLVGALDIADFYKGFDRFRAALRHLETDGLHVVFFGRASRDVLAQLGVAHTSLGFLHDEVALRLAYSAADVFVAPSLMEAFGKTIVESMACGTPVVCFDATGPRDIVTHQLTGYRARPFDPADLAQGIRWVLSLLSEDYAALCEAARRRAVENFDSSVIARHYLGLYRQLLKTR